MVEQKEKYDNKKRYKLSSQSRDLASEIWLYLNKLKEKEIIIKQLKQTSHNWSSQCSKLRGPIDRVTHCHGLPETGGFSECGTFSFKIMTVLSILGSIGHLTHQMSV